MRPASYLFGRSETYFYRITYVKIQNTNPLYFSLNVDVVLQYVRVVRVAVYYRVSVETVGLLVEIYLGVVVIVVGGLGVVVLDRVGFIRHTVVAYRGGDYIGVVVEVLGEVYLLTLLVEHSYVESERLELLDHNLEGLGYAGLGDVLALDYGLVGLYAAGGVVRLDGEDLLQRICRAIGLERPDFHFSESLAAELRLAAQRLLCNQSVGAERAWILSSSR